MTTMSLWVIKKTCSFSKAIWYLSIYTAWIKLSKSWAFPISGAECKLIAAIIYTFDAHAASGSADASNETRRDSYHHEELSIRGVKLALWR